MVGCSLLLLLLSAGRGGNGGSGGIGGAGAAGGGGVWESWFRWSCGRFGGWLGVGSAAGCFPVGSAVVGSSELGSSAGLSLAPAPSPEAREDHSAFMFCLLGLTFRSEGSSTVNGSWRRQITVGWELERLLSSDKGPLGPCILFCGVTRPNSIGY